MALELSPEGIRVNAICPGTVDTPIVSEVAEKFPADLDPRVMDRLMMMLPGPAISPRELGESIVYGTVFGSEGEKGGTVRVLGLAGYPRTVAPRLAELARKHGLLLVDWCATTVWEPTDEGFVEA